MNVDTLIQMASKLEGAPAQRLHAELAYARQVSHIHDSRYDTLITQAARHALNAAQQEGALTRAAMAEAEEMLSPMAEVCKRYTWLLTGHAHMDMNWLWPYEETVTMVLDTVRTVLTLMKEHPHFTFGQSQASVYRILEEYAPDLLEKVRARIRCGQWEVTACGWVEADRNMPSLASELRHLLHTRRYLSSLLDIPENSLPLDFEPDTFGHNARLPDVLCQNGVKYLYHCRGTNDLPLYRWQGPAGGELLVFCDPAWYNTSADPAMVFRVPAFCHEHHVPALLTVFGVGDHGGGPTRKDLVHFEDMMTWPIFPTVRYGTYREFFSLCEQGRNHLPLVKGERNCVFTGCYTTQTRIKRANALSERLLYASDLFRAFAPDGGQLSAASAQAWEKVLFNQFHDIVPGSNIRESREYAMGQYQQVYAHTQAARRKTYRAIADRVDTSAFSSAVQPDENGLGAGVGSGLGGGRVGETSHAAGDVRIFHIFNDLPFARRTNVEITVWDYVPGSSRMCFTDAQGKELPWQQTGEGDFWCAQNHYVRGLVPVELPACGYTTVILRPKDVAFSRIPMQTPDMRQEVIAPMTLENDLVRAEFDPISMRITSFVDKRTGKVLLTDGGFDLIAEERTDMSAWDIGRYMEVLPVGANISVRRTAAGPLRQAYEVKAHFASSTLTYTVSLDAGSTFLTYTADCDWHELGDERHAPQLSFGVRLPQAEERFLYRIPGSELHRGSDRQDKPSLGIITGGGAALICPDRYGFRGDDDQMRVTLIRSSIWPDAQPESGSVPFTLMLAPCEAALEQQYRHAAHGLDVVTGEIHPGELGLHHSFLRVDGEQVELAAVKPAEEDGGLILHLSSHSNSAQQVTLTFGQAVASAHLTDAVERETGALLKIAEKQVTVPMVAHGLASVRVIFDEPGERKFK